MWWISYVVLKVAILEFSLLNPKSCIGICQIYNDMLDRDCGQGARRFETIHANVLFRVIRPAHHHVNCAELFP